MTKSTKFKWAVVNPTTGRIMRTKDTGRQAIFRTRALARSSARYLGGRVMNRNDLTASTVSSQTFNHQPTF